MEWINVKNKLPAFDEFVLIYYEIESNEEIFRYFDIASPIHKYIAKIIHRLNGILKIGILLNNSLDAFTGSSR